MYKFALQGYQGENPHPVTPHGNQESQGNQESNADDIDDLEAQQTGRRESARELSEGDDADLTELAAPAPINPTHSRDDSLEHEESEARREQTHDSKPEEEDGEEDAGLTEVAAPAPVKRRGSQMLEDEGSAASPTNGTDEKKPLPKEPEHSHAATNLYLHAHLIFFSILGTLARLGIEAITAFPGAPFLSPVVWANLAGCFVIGLLSEDRRLFRAEWGTQSEEWSFHPSKYDESDEDPEKLKALREAHGKVKKTIPLFVGLAVGFCGSVTSFSSFVRDAFLAGIDKLPLQAGSSYNSNGYGFESSIGILLIQVAVSIGALSVGAHTALALDRYMLTLPFRMVRSVLDPLIVFSGFGCWVGAILMAIRPPQNHNDWRGQVLFSLVFAPLGCLARFHVSLLLNTRLPAFPLGTFVINVGGTAVLGMCYDLQHSHIGDTVIACQILVGVMEGFCGCITTVSTWVLEMDTLRARHAYIYGLSSVTVAISFLVVIIGSLAWTRGLATPACSQD